MIKRVVFCGFMLLALPAARGRDEPKDDKKPPTAREQYTRLVKQFDDERLNLRMELPRLKGPDATRVRQKLTDLGKVYADKFYKLVEENPKDPVATDALFWLVQYADGHPRAEEKVLALIAEMPLSELAGKLRSGFSSSSHPILDAVLKRADHDDPLAGDLLGWLAARRSPIVPGKTAPSVEKATARLIEKYPDHPAVERLCQLLGWGNSAEDAAVLKTIIASVSAVRLKAEATLALGRVLAAQLDALDGNAEQTEKLIAEADKVLSAAVELFGKEKLDEQKETAERELNAFRTLRVGKEAPEISGKDLDGKEFKLSDYRGKVVLLDFWGHW